MSFCTSFNTTDTDSCKAYREVLLHWPPSELLKLVSDAFKNYDPRTLTHKWPPELDETLQEYVKTLYSHHSALEGFINDIESIRDKCKKGEEYNKQGIIDDNLPIFLDYTKLFEKVCTLKYTYELIDYLDRQREKAESFQGSIKEETIELIDAFKDALKSNFEIIDDVIEIYRPIEFIRGEFEEPLYKAFGKLAL